MQQSPGNQGTFWVFGPDVPYFPGEHRSARRVLDLMQSPTGRAWWRIYGVALELAFDVDPAGRGWKVVRKYLAEPRRTECGRTPADQPDAGVV